MNTQKHENSRRSKVVVITTINSLTEAIKRFASIPGWSCIVVGDRKTPPAAEFEHPEITFLPYEGQQDLGFRLSSHLPPDHYCRKNLGYLFALRGGADIVGESDDDNIPYDAWGCPLPLGAVSECSVVSAPEIVNVYKFFSKEHIWPRGLPLSAIDSDQPVQYTQESRCRVLIGQALVDGNPDVDAIFRLVFKGKAVKFRQLSDPIVLGRGVYCPFNSQNTLWSKEASAYLYLPITVSFRFTDILRSYVAQRGIWELGGRLGFTNASAYQERNYHDLMKDFADELSCYLHTGEVISTLKRCVLHGNPQEDLRTMYGALCRAGIVQVEELAAIDDWLADLSSIQRCNP